MKRAILTGFGPYNYNPVMDTTREYDGIKIGEVEIVGLVLPCTYYGAYETLSQKIDAFSPDMILSTGLASRILRMRLEAAGKNMMNGKYPDADGRKPVNQPIIPGERDFYHTNVDNFKLANSIYREGIPSEVSFDAEGFICNSLIYQTARKIEKDKLPIKFAFIHTPWTDDYMGKIEIEAGKVMIKKKDLKRTIEILLKNMLLEQN